MPEGTVGQERVNIQACHQVAPRLEGGDERTARIPQIHRSYGLGLQLARIRRKRRLIAQYVADSAPRLSLKPDRELILLFRAHHQMHPRSTVEMS